MSQQSAGKSRLFLMELLIMLLFFALSVSVCLQLFTKAYTLTKKSQDLTEAVTLAQSTASLLKSGEMNTETLQKQWPSGQNKDGDFLLYLDEDWNECSETESSCYLQVAFSPGAIVSSEISIWKTAAGEKIYSLEVNKYQEVHYE